MKDKLVELRTDCDDKTMKAEVLDYLIEFAELDPEYIEGHIEDILQYGCVSGTVSPMIYYNDTHKFFKKHFDEIMDLVEELEEETGQAIKIDGDRKNGLAWLGFEETVRFIAYELDLDY